MILGVRIVNEYEFIPVGIFIWCKCICIYSYGAFLKLKNYHEWVYMKMGF